MSIKKNLTNVPISRERERVNITVEKVPKIKLKQQLFAKFYAVFMKVILITVL